MRTEYVEAVLELVALIPAGAAVAYGDVAELLGAGGPRQVGSVMSHHGSSVPWWRVLKSSGDAPPGLEHEALALYLQDGTPLLGRYEDFLRIDAIAERLERESHKLSVPDDEMTV